MVGLLGRRKRVPANDAARAWNPIAAPRGEGWRFTLKGSPRHYYDVVRVIEEGGGAKVWFGEPLAYERGAGIALWRVQADTFDWLPRLYRWWAEMERIEPVGFTFHLYLPDDPKYPALDLREHTADDVAAFIKQRAPKGPG